eukprot:GHVR01141816.1.p1 GENE.GHVR01141816.1~~GHVR01141816.1.p1  ORF type:complete len:122 (-),score=6.18 GHVR01141816.1:252-617(-)
MLIQQDTSEAYQMIYQLSSRNEQFVMPVISYGLINTAILALPGVIGFRIAATYFFLLSVDLTKNLIVFCSRNLQGKSRVSIEVPVSILLSAKYPFPKSSEDVFYESTVELGGTSMTVPSVV